MLDRARRTIGTTTELFFLFAVTVGIPALLMGQVLLILMPGSPGGTVA
jgi:hypothetical protein